MPGFLFMSLIYSMTGYFASFLTDLRLYRCKRTMLNKLWR